MNKPQCLDLHIIDRDEWVPFVLCENGMADEFGKYVQADAAYGFSDDLDELDLTEEQHAAAMDDINAQMFRAVNDGPKTGTLTFQGIEHPYQVTELA